MKAVYMGEGEVEVFGLTFQSGVPVSVSDPHAQSKLSKHPLFIVEEDAPPAAEKKAKK